ncbi:LPXTG cell wall anchor domain-containing protein [Listeria ilorinensis]|uniref:LPXTG cell wall anchor domain-containing protein n=1 Tax=Listeria ilorinensis TaxID=2867439 RepID=UPI001EF47E59|nr:LPXTG cell wall anchor domain-containing protein [Listeria ilorinensis]
MNTDIQIYGQLGLGAPETPDEPDQPSTTNEKLVPHYVVQQQSHPKTGDTNQLFFFSFLGLLLVILAIWILLKEKIRSKKKSQE